ncbi:MAG: DUF1778 domain-containing protein [Halopseudomonas sp.]|uniref:type II toxin-antitoxin system TacA family antitoxin n=1 Tax=Halopseudomonas sp. TaxID=2901191 RepID=UPI0030038566|tara:strand:- start:11 stop:262 length:252 start_codon:yes stop_codon:yes gene_type:complete
MVGEICEFTVDVGLEALEKIECAAKLCNQSVSDFMLDSAIEKAIDVLLTDKVAFLSAAAYKEVCRDILSAFEVPSVDGRQVKG